MLPVAFVANGLLLHIARTTSEENVDFSLKRNMEEKEKNAEVAAWQVAEVDSRMFREISGTICQRDLQNSKRIYNEI